MSTLAGCRPLGQVVRATQFQQRASIWQEVSVCVYALISARGESFALMTIIIVRINNICMNNTEAPFPLLANLGVAWS